MMKSEKRPETNTKTQEETPANPLTWGPHYSQTKSRIFDKRDTWEEKHPKGSLLLTSYCPFLST